MFPNDIPGAALRVRANTAGPLEGLGEAVHKTPCLLKAVYDFSVLGGAVGDISLVDDVGNPAVLPVGAIVTRVWANVLTSVLSGSSATVALKALVAADLMAATAKASLVSSAPFVEGKPIDTAATFVGPCTVPTTVKATVAVGALTAGKIQYYISYVIQ